MTLFGVDVYHNGMVGVFHLKECLGQCGYVVALLHIHIVESHGAEEVQLGLALCLAQQGEVGVQSAVVFGYAHLVVVHHDDYACAKFGCHVQTFKRLAAAETAVAYQGDDVLLGAAHVARLLQSCGQSHGSGCVADLKLVVNGGLQRTAIAGNVVDAACLGESEGSSGEHLVGVRLVGNVEHYLVFGKIEHPTQGYRGFGDTKIGAYVAAMCAHSVQYAAANFFGQHLQLFVVELFCIVRLVDFLYIHIYIIMFVFVLRCKITALCGDKRYPDY